jgi:hypothetical protein
MKRPNSTLFVIANIVKAVRRIPAGWSGAGIALGAAVGKCAMSAQSLHNIVI